MTLTSWIAELRAAGVTRVVLDIATPSAGARGHLPLDFPHGSFPPDQAPRPPQGDANAQAESTNVHSEKGDEPDPDKRARDLELMHSE